MSAALPSRPTIAVARDVSAGSPVRRALEPGGRTCASSATRPCSQRSRS